MPPRKPNVSASFRPSNEYEVSVNGHQTDASLPAEKGQDMTVPGRRPAPRHSEARAKKGANSRDVSFQDILRSSETTVSLPGKYNFVQHYAGLRQRADFVSIG